MGPQANSRTIVTTRTGRLRQKSSWLVDVVWQLAPEPSHPVVWILLLVTADTTWLDRRGGGKPVAVDVNGGVTPDMRILQCGDAGLLLEFPDLAAARRMYAAIERTPPAGTTDLVPAAVTLLVRFDPAVADPAQIERVLRSTSAEAEVTGSGELVNIPVCYDGADLEDVAAHTGLSPRQVIEAHTGRDWTVAFGGFAPGFAYLVDGDPSLAVPRRPESRTRVPKGAVGLAGGFSGVYPRTSPGGWQLIGHTEADMWDIDREPPALLLPGSRMRFHEAPA